MTAKPADTASDRSSAPAGATLPESVVAVSDAEAAMPQGRRTGGTHRRGAERYSRLVSALKVALPTLAVVLLTLVVLWPQLSADPDSASPLSYARLTAPQQKTQSMQKAEYHGFGKNGLPFTVSADQARENAPGSQLIDLSNPKADITLRSGAWVLLEADAGQYDQVGQTLVLEGAVNMFHDAGYEMHTSRLMIDISAGEATGPEPVTGRGPRGQIDGQGLRITGNGSVVTVTGKSRLLLFSAKGGH